jgi:hypothetical protein
MNMWEIIGGYRYGSKSSYAKSEKSLGVVYTALLAKGKRKVGKTKETAETMNAIIGTFSVIIMIVIALCGVTTWLIFRKLKCDNSAFMDMHDEEIGKNKGVI